jgi:dihydroorotase
VHGEVTAPHIDIFDREAVFIGKVLQPLLARLPALRLVLEHITTKQAVDFVRSAPDNVAASITPQHMLLNRNAIFEV